MRVTMLNEDEKDELEVVFGLASDAFKRYRNQVDVDGDDHPNTQRALMATYEAWDEAFIYHLLSVHLGVVQFEMRGDTKTLVNEIHDGLKGGSMQPEDAADHFASALEDLHAVKYAASEGGGDEPGP